jgi:hypothetical protein
MIEDFVNKTGIHIRGSFGCNCCASMEFGQPALQKNDTLWLGEVVITKQEGYHYGKKSRQTYDCRREAGGGGGGEAIRHHNK